MSLSNISFPSKATAIKIVYTACAVSSMIGAAMGIPDPCLATNSDEIILTNCTGVSVSCKEYSSEVADAIKQYIASNSTDTSFGVKSVCPTI